MTTLSKYINLVEKLNSKLNNLFKTIVEDEDDIFRFSKLFNDEDEQDYDEEKEDKKNLLVKYFDNRDKEPKIKLKEKDDKYTIIGQCPGIKKDNLNIELNTTDKILNISYESKQEQKDEKDDYFREIVSYNKFQKKFYLPELDIEKTNEIKASLKDGVLYIEIPKIKENKQKININID